MIIVADTSPIHYLILIGAVDVLPALYGRVLIPSAVAQELTASGTPETVQAWMAQRPSWLEVHPDPPINPALAFLDPGEQAAITLVESVAADRLLIDERNGRREAQRRRLNVTGTVGVLVEAHLVGLLVFDEALMHLKSTNFRLRPEIEGEMRRRLSREH
jgi:predicted nucleic acid-binding protein